MSNNHHEQEKSWAASARADSGSNFAFPLSEESKELIYLPFFATEATRFLQQRTVSWLNQVCYEVLSDLGLTGTAAAVKIG